MSQNFPSSVPSLVDETEIASLAARYGKPVRWSRSLDVTGTTIDEKIKALKKRRGEAVLAIPRPNHRVLLHIKDFYPPGAYRLLSGGVELGEPVEDAVKREIWEETGFKIKPARFLGVVEYEFRNQAHIIPGVSYVFLTEETSEPPQVMDTGEKIADFLEIEWGGLAQVAEQLERLPGDWSDWGRYRAIPHRLAAEFTL